MVVETSEASKDQQTESATGETTRARARARIAKSAAGENNTCTCRVCNLISAEKATSQREKMSCYVMQWTMSSLRPSNSGRYLRALPTIRVHPELDGRTLDIVHS